VIYLVDNYSEAVSSCDGSGAAGFFKRPDGSRAVACGWLVFSVFCNQMSLGIAVLFLPLVWGLMG